jgi:integrase
MPGLTDAEIKALPIPQDGQITYSDGNSPLKIRISRGGTKTFIVVLTNGKRHTLGRYGEISLQEARTAARRLKAERTLGRIIPSTLSLETARSQYLSTISVRPATLAYYERHLSRLTGKLPYSASHIALLLNTLPQTSRNQAIATYSAFFEWCIKQRLIETNPCAHFSLKRKKPRERILSDNELRAIWLACSNDSFGRIVKLLILTGQRRNEIASAHSSWIRNDTLTIPAYISKNHHEHSIPLTPLARSLIPPSNSLLFPSLADTVFSGFSKPKAALDKASNIYNWTLHDLRRTFATKLAELGTEPHIIEATLNHRTGTLTPIARTYNRYAYLPQIKAALLLYEAHILRLLKNTSTFP